MSISTKNLKRSRPEDLRRFAKWLNLKHIDEMSHRNLAKLVRWLITRREKRERGLTL